MRVPFAFRRTRPLLWLPTVLLLVAAPAVRAEENPIVTRVKAQLEHPDRPFTLVLRLRVKEGAGEKLEKAFATAARATRREKGCLAYDLSREAKQHDRYLVYERWKSVADLETHLGTAHIKTLLEELHPLLAGAPESEVLVPAGE